VSGVSTVALSLSHLYGTDYSTYSHSECVMHSLPSFEYSAHCVANLLLEQMHKKSFIIIFFFGKKYRRTY
jgi:hypothetical protein